jgi:4'-phosphopantetheinyl transferase EntD
MPCCVASCPGTVRREGLDASRTSRADVVIEELLPSAVAAVDTTTDCLDLELFPEEELALGQAVDKRRREFVTARACARQALARLGLPASPIVNGERGEPSWPSGVIGSITHCAGYRACALAPAVELAGLGIDAEPNAPLPDGVLGEIASPRERRLLAVLPPAEDGVHWDRLLFSAKESVYKVWFPLARRWLGFEDAELTIDPAARTFRARLSVAWPQEQARLPRELVGRWLAREGLVLSAIALAHPE